MSHLSDNSEFFSKEILNYESGNCRNNREVYPCSHDNVKITYVDGTIKYFRIGQLEMEAMCKKLNKDLPPHFAYMLERHLMIKKSDNVLF